MREISPIYNLSSDEVLNQIDKEFLPLVEKIRSQKLSNTRAVPSVSLIDKSSILTAELRHKLIDKIALLVDENLFGRSEMCHQFSLLLSLALECLGLNAKPVIGTAIYYIDSKEIFRWEHAWVRVGTEVIDGNVDILEENPRVPENVKIQPYWGPVKETPRDRMLRQNHSRRVANDSDVEAIWWPDLLEFMNTESVFNIKVK